MKNYIAITPARDEEELLPGLIASMASQTRLPARWIIIDDGSTDSTAEIIEDAARKYPWVEPHHLAHRRKRAPGGESVVMQFLPPRLWEQHEFILHVDADMTFDSVLAESLIIEFERDAALGIAGPVLWEPTRSGWQEVHIPRFHIPGGLKMYSRSCFAAIGGLEPGLGWDTIDEARALMLGFRTSNFPPLRGFHHRPQGSANGVWRTRLAQGHAAYYAGYSPIFVLARAARRTLDRPPIVGGVLLIAGYCQGYLKAWPRAVSPELIKFVRRQQLRRLLLMESVWR